MAKKNSSKTATEKAIQSSEPRVISFKGWQGVNFVDAPIDWEPLQTGSGKFRQTDEPNNFLMVQNNLNTTPLLGLETRRDSILIGNVPPDDDDIENWRFTGVSCVYKQWLLCVVRGRSKNGDGWEERIAVRKLTKGSEQPWAWRLINVKIGDKLHRHYYEICELGYYGGNLVAMVRNYNDTPDSGVLCLAELGAVDTDDGQQLTITGHNWHGETTSDNGYVSDTPMITNPNIQLELTVLGMQHSTTPTDEAPVRVEVCFCYTNQLGSTITNASRSQANIATIYTEYSPALWTTKRYVRITTPGDPSVPNSGSTITGVDLYARDTENTDWVFIGHVNISPSAARTEHGWHYNWYGNMTDITQWMTSQLMVPTDNTTNGPDATHFACHDSRLYFWGMPTKPYRLWIGGNPGSEFSVARGLGGAWVDIEPGSGYDIKGTAKWKTTSGANIVTIMCGNRNTTKVKRFNLVETNLAMTNEISYKSYMYEEVSNVVGCNSRWGYGVFADGLYALSRWGLMVTTMAMEYNAQMKSESLSEAIEPIFNERIGRRLSDSRLVYIDGVIYIALSEDDNEWKHPISLDNVILCYDIGLKAWYTWTHDQTLGSDKSEDPDQINHILAIDSEDYIEGLGVITSTQVRLYPTTGIPEETVPPFKVLLETGELMPRNPMQAFWYIQQLEFRFDYLIGNPSETATILIEGVDYYGRQFRIEKRINKRSRGHHGAGGVQRDFVEWVRIDKIVESLRIRIIGKVRFRLTHINAKVYQQADVIGTPYGFDARDTYRDKHGKDHVIHHYIDDYNNLRRAVVS